MHLNTLFQSLKKRNKIRTQIKAVLKKRGPVAAEKRGVKPKQISEVETNHSIATSPLVKTNFFLSFLHSTPSTVSRKKKSVRKASVFAPRTTKDEFWLVRCGHSSRLCTTRTYVHSSSIADVWSCCCCCCIATPDHHHHLQSANWKTLKHCSPLITNQVALAHFEAFTKERLLH